MIQQDPKEVKPFFPDTLGEKKYIIETYMQKMDTNQFSNFQIPNIE